jgi:SAM-dependent methyltransferase
MFGKKKFDPHIKIVPDFELRNANRQPYNKICDLTDWRDGKFTEYLAKLGGAHFIHRKAWEYANCVWGLEELGAVRQDSVALSVGAGYERPLFYFANFISKMIATDIYDGRGGGEGNPEMLTNPEKFAYIDYRREHLEVLQMSGLDLQFPADTFDFIFSLSSIEHFGGHENAARAMQEMYRVLKPDGICCIATELILNNQSNGEFFTFQELQKYILTSTPFTLTGTDLDLRVSESLLKYPVNLGEEKNLRVSPHIILRSDDCIFTSIILFFHK